MLKLIQSINIPQKTLQYETWRLFDAQFDSKSQRKNVLTMVEEIIALIINSIGNTYKIVVAEKEFYDQHEEDKEDEKENYNNDPHKPQMIFNPTDDDYYQDTPSTIYDKNEELWHFMQYKLQIPEENCQIFKIKQNNLTKKPRKIQLKHIRSLWHQLVKRIDGEMLQYKDKCLFCFDKLLSDTPITLNCCSLSIHYNCLEKYISSGFGNNGTRITLQQLSCPLYRHPMKHKSAKELFKDTQILYNKVQKIAINQLKVDGKLNDIAITNDSSEFYMNPDIIENVFCDENNNKYI